MIDDVQIRYWTEQVALFNDQESFKKLFLHFNSNLHRLSFSIVGSEEIADDILAETFVNLWQGRMRLVEVQNLTVYLYVCVKNLSIKYIARNRKEGFFTLDELYFENIPSGSQSPEDLMISREMLSIIEQAVNKLPPKCKLIFRLIREDGLKYKEVSKILNISIKTIDAQMAIASKKIASSLNLLLK